MILDNKKLFRYFLMLLISLILFFYGVIGIVAEGVLHKREITDQEVIKRATELGYIKITDVILGEDNE
jgi:hypothetical protein